MSDLPMSIRAPFGYLLSEVLWRKWRRTNEPRGKASRSYRQRNRKVKVRG